MRAAAEVGEVALRVEGDRPLRGVDELHLVVLALARRSFAFASSASTSSRVHSRPSFSSRAISASMLLEVVLADRLRELEVVVEAVLDRRADRDLHARVEAAHGLGEQVRASSAAARRARRGRALSRVVTIWICSPVRRAAGAGPGPPVRAQEHRLLGELRPDRARGVEPGRAVGKFEFGLSGRTTFMTENVPQPRLAKTTATRSSTTRRLPIPRAASPMRRTIPAQISAERRHRTQVRRGCADAGARASHDDLRVTRSTHARYVEQLDASNTIASSNRSRTSRNTSLTFQRA